MNKIDVPTKYIGIPFKEDGEDLSGTNCIGLAKLFIQNEKGIKVSKLPSDIKKAQENSDKYRGMLEPILLHELIPGDIPFFAFPGRRWHCGVYIGYGKILHTIRPLFKNKKSFSLVSPIFPQWRQYYLGAIRTQDKKEIIVPDADGIIGVIALIVSTIISIYSVVAALTAPKPKFGNDTGSPKYGFDVLDNTMSNELIYPLIFGQNKVAGNVIWYKTSGDIIYKFILLGIGPINSISDVRVNDIPVGNLPGCSYTAYLGTPTQNVDSRAAGEVKGLRNIAYLAVTLAPSEKLNGSQQTVTCVVEGLKMKTWNGSIWTGETYSRNPAACYRKLLTIPREDGGIGADESEINDAAFGEIYDQCAALVDDGAGGTHARHQFDFVFDAEKPFPDAITEILQPYGMFSTVDEKINLGILKAETSIYNFNEDNINADSFKYYQISKNDSYNKVIVKYTDSEQNDVPVDAKSEDQIDQIQSGAVRPGEFSFAGINRFAEASRRAEFIRNESNINIWMCEFDVDIDALHNTPGDVVTMTHSLPGWVSKPIRILSITEDGNFKRHVIAKEENSSIHNDTMGSVIETYDYGSPPNAYGPVTDIANLTITEGAYYKHKDGTVGSDILLSWSAPSDKSRQFLNYYQIEFKKGAGSYEVAATTSKTSHTIFAVEDEVTYKVRIKTVSINNIFSDGVESVELTVLGKLQPPSNVTGFDVYQEGGLLKFVWNAVTDVDLSRYIIRKGTEWASGQTIGERVDLTDYMYPVGETGLQTFMIKAIDRSGIESTASAYDSLTVIPPPDMNFLNDFDLWSIPLEFELNNLELIQVPYHDSNFNRIALAFKTATTWEEREAEAKTWEQQETDGGLILDQVFETSGSFEMIQPYDLDTIFSFKIITDADYKAGENCTLTVQISISEDGITYSAFADVNANAQYSARYVKFKIVFASANSAYTPYLYDLLIYINAPQVKKAYGQDVAIPLAGKAIIFDVGFTLAPRVKADIVNGILGVIKISNKTKDGMDLRVYDLASSAIDTAEVDYEAAGI